MEDSISYAKKYLEDVLSFFGLNTDVSATHEGEVIQLNVPSSAMNGFLIGQHGDTMRSFQFLTSSALKNTGHEFWRVNVDIAGYKQQRADRLAEQAQAWVEKVKSTNEPMDLKPLNAADRRVIHKVADEAGLATESVGMGRDRHVVLKPAADAAAVEADES